MAITSEIVKTITTNMALYKTNPHVKTSASIYPGLFILFRRWQQALILLRLVFGIHLFQMMVPHFQLFSIFVVVGRYYRMTINMGRFFNYPVFLLLFIEAAFVTYKVLNLLVLIKSCRYLYYLFALHPEGYLAAAFFAIAVGIHRLGIPYTAAETCCAVGKGAYRANVDNVAREILIHYIRNVGTYFSH